MLLHLIRFHLLIADTEAAEIYAHQTVLMKTHCVYCLCVSGIQRYIFYATCSQYGKFLRDVSKQLGGNFLFVTVKYSGVPLITWISRPPTIYLPKHKGMILQKRNKAGSKRLEGRIVV